MANKRAVSVNELLTKTYKTMSFEDDWADFIGCPERTGSWLIWGNSGQGKTRFALQLSKYMSHFGRVAYNSLEEGASQSMAMAVRDLRMSEVKGRFILLDMEPVNELVERLERHKSPDIIIIDSLQYTGMNYSQYKSLRDQFRNKLFIFISHADGKEPAGRVAKSIRFDAFVKIRVEGFKAFPTSRYGGGSPFNIWSEGAADYWGIND
jgi:predicted ATP-dependent serine protease